MRVVALATCVSQARYRDELEAMTDESEVQSGPSMKEIVAQQQAFVAAQARASKSLLSTPDTKPNPGQAAMGSGGQVPPEGMGEQELSEVKEGDVKAVRESDGEGAVGLGELGGVGVARGGVENGVQQQGWGWSRRHWGSAGGVGVLTLGGCVMAALQRRRRRRGGERKGPGGRVGVDELQIRASAAR